MPGMGSTVENSELFQNMINNNERASNKSLTYCPIAELPYC